MAIFMTTTVSLSFISKASDEPLCRTNGWGPVFQTGRFRWRSVSIQFQAPFPPTPSCCDRKCMHIARFVKLPLSIIPNITCLKPMVLCGSYFIGLVNAKNYRNTWIFHQIWMFPYISCKISHQPILGLLYWTWFIWVIVSDKHLPPVSTRSPPRPRCGRPNAQTAGRRCS